MDCFGLLVLLLWSGGVFWSGLETAKGRDTYCASMASHDLGNTQPGARENHEASWKWREKICGDGDAVGMGSSHVTETPGRRSGSEKGSMGNRYLHYLWFRVSRILQLHQVQQTPHKGAIWQWLSWQGLDGQMGQKGEADSEKDTSMPPSKAPNLQGITTASDQTVCAKETSATTPHMNEASNSNCKEKQQSLVSSLSASSSIQSHEPTHNSTNKADQDEGAVVSTYAYGILAAYLTMFTILYGLVVMVLNRIAEDETDRHPTTSAYFRTSAREQLARRGSF